jgi:hydroxyacid-oxoacid transhydrogenase
MTCHHHLLKGGDPAFTVDASRVTFGRGCIAELGDRVRALGLARVGVFTDKRVRALPIFERALASLRAAHVDAAIYDDVRVEPTDASVQDAALFARDAAADGWVSVGGGSTMDTCKVASLLATHGGPLLDWVNAPVGAGRAVPGPLPPHVACPTTSGTGSEVTGIAIFGLRSLSAKTGIASPALRPTEALIDPDATASLPCEVVAASGLDVLSHALESYTARPYGHRPAPARPTLRPMSQGRNPWSDVGCGEALRLLGAYFLRAVRDATDAEAREQVQWAATLAGIAFGNAGVHVPHAMAYAVAGLVREYRPAGYPQEEPMVPHGTSVILNAPSVFRWTAPTSPERHIRAAGWLGADVRGAAPEDAGRILSERLVAIMQAVAMPNGLRGVGYSVHDVPALVAGTLPQQRLLQNAPLAADERALGALFEGALAYW